ncbi:MAG TPA: FG-GAP repeat protein, partial [Nitrospira sp.]|nr:FG-GAP repeat protein [Nitrospira sp.]
MTFLSRIRRFCTFSALSLGTMALSGCPGSGGDSSVALLTQQAYLKASNTGPGDSFSTTIAFDGDTLVIGAPFEDSSLTGNPADNNASGSGAVYVFTKSAGVWS